LLVEKYPLIDELAIVDSHSTDDTLEIADKYGVKVFFEDEPLDELGKAAGKGEALWKSLFFLKGDIIAWLDSDIQNIHPRFVYGTVGPLLADDTLAYVKGFYERPLKTAGVMHETGGGRVTELVARPFLTLFYPRLAGFIQPLSGEYAGRREVLESIPFFTGYGVETGLLIDILNKYGLDSMAQVNLDTRVHHNQTIKQLGRMAFRIMQVAFERLDEDDKIKMMTDMNRTMQLVKRRGEDHRLEPKEITGVERPPIDTVKQYKEKMKKRKKKWQSKQDDK
jgi:glucosyl-3-phosphoglycerate synthase